MCTYMVYDRYLIRLILLQNYGFFIHLNPHRDPIVPIYTSLNMEHLRSYFRECKHEDGVLNNSAERTGSIGDFITKEQDTTNMSEPKDQRYMM